MPKFFLDIQVRQLERPGNSITIPLQNVSLGQQKARVPDILYSNHASMVKS